MKRIFLAIFSIAMLASCNQSGQQNQPAKDGAKQDTPRETEKVRKPLSFSGAFYQITNMGSPDIVFTEGDYSIEAEGPASLLNAVNIEVDSHVLTVSIKNEENFGTNQFSSAPSRITLYVSCPSLQILAVCGTGNFKSVGPIHTPDIQIGMLGTGNLELDSVFTTGSFSYESSGDGNAIFQHIRSAHECNFMISGAGSTTADVDVAEQLLMHNDHTGNVVISGKANTADLIILGESNCVADFDADQLHLTALYGNVTLNGKYRQKEVQQGKKAIITN